MSFLKQRSARRPPNNPRRLSTSEEPPPLNIHGGGNGEEDDDIIVLLSSSSEEEAKVEEDAKVAAVPGARADSNEAISIASSSSEEEAKVEEDAFVAAVPHARADSNEAISIASSSSEEEAKVEEEVAAVPDARGNSNEAISIASSSSEECELPSADSANLKGAFVHSSDPEAGTMFPKLQSNIKHFRGNLSRGNKKKQTRIGSPPTSSLFGCLGNLLPGKGPGKPSSPNSLDEEPPLEDEEPSSEDEEPSLEELIEHLQSVSDHGGKNVKDRNWKMIDNLVDGVLSTVTHDGVEMFVPIFKNDLPALRDFIENDQDFANLVNTLRSDEDYCRHVQKVENAIYYELAELMAHPYLKTNWRLIIEMKCPKHEQLANGENLETGGAVDMSLRDDCASIIAANVVESALPPTHILRGGGTKADYSNARRLCIKDTSDGSCGCLDWQDKEIKCELRRLKAIGIYHKLKCIPSAVISFGGNSALRVMKGIERDIFTYINAIYAPHLCTFVCHYGYTSVKEQLKSLYRKVSSISGTLDLFWRHVKRQDPSFIAPHESMLETLCKSEETPFVNKPTSKNIAKALEAWSVTLSKRAKQWWKHADNREKHMKARWSKEQRKKQSDLMKTRWSKEQRKKQSDWKTEWWKVGDRREKHSDLVKKQWKDEGYRLKQQRGWTKERRRSQGDVLNKIKDEMSAADKSTSAMKGVATRKEKGTRKANISDNPILSEGHFIDAPAVKTKLKDKVDGNETVIACKYCLEAYENGEIEPYRSNIIMDGTNKMVIMDGTNKVYALRKWNASSAQMHLARCQFAPQDVNNRDFRYK